MSTVGILVNPRSGSDVRRLLTSAGSSTVEDKVSILRRIIHGATEAGAEEVVLTRDPFSITRRATENLHLPLKVAFLDLPLHHNERDSVDAARAMRDAGCGSVVSLGGDGTNRALALGWPDAPLIPISTGTNNAFPVHVEPTVAGVAAGLVATGAVSLMAHSARAKVVAVEVTGGDTGTETDMALVDAIAVDDPYVGSLELFDPETMMLGVLTQADPAAIGFSGLAGTVLPCPSVEERGVVLEFAPPSQYPARLIRAALAPGWFAAVGLVRSEYLDLDTPVEVDGPCLLAFDGERSRRLHAGQTASLRVVRQGPRVIDVGAVVHSGARTGAFELRVGNSDL
ncbi:NAD(+)/NADH kinase [Candidatus Poriferisocius sp.]|uniref:NAD(+)/NADH kinase n=1 Tax=Candidatus Poriferisocius sp. TaxID=3101276 RepID=UPI003B02C7E3